MQSQETGFNKNDLINALGVSTHGNYNDLISIGLEAAKADPEFLGHVITWNLNKGEVRDSKVAFPVCGLRYLTTKDGDLAENAIANLMELDPRNLMKAYDFNKRLSKATLVISGGWRRMFEEAIRKYLQVREEFPNWMERAILQHRKSIKSLYCVSHTKPNDYVRNIVFDKKYPKDSVFDKIANLSRMTTMEQAGVIINHHLPVDVVFSALGKPKQDFIDNPELALAIMSSLSGQQLIMKTHFLKSLGVMKSPVLKSVFQEALIKAAGDTKVSTLKAGKAIDFLKENNADTNMIQTLSDLQEKKIDQNLSIEGDWLILADKSGSMDMAIDLAKEVAGVMSRAVKGKTYLCFFDQLPHTLDVTGATLETIKFSTSRIYAGGCTSCGIGIKYFEENDIKLNGIILISDGGDNTTPKFHTAYSEYSEKIKLKPNVYFFKVPGEFDVVSSACRSSNIRINKFEVSQDVDYYSIPNLVAMVKPQMFGLYDEIMKTPFLTLEGVFNKQIQRYGLGKK